MKSSFAFVAGLSAVLLCTTPIAAQSPTGIHRRPATRQRRRPCGPGRGRRGRQGGARCEDQGAEATAAAEAAVKAEAEAKAEAEKQSVLESWTKAVRFPSEHRAVDKRGLNVFETTKTPGVEYRLQARHRRLLHRAGAGHGTRTPPLR